MSIFWDDKSVGELASRLYDLCAAGLLSVLGGSAAYIYKTVKEDTGFSIKHFCINAFLAFFIGNMVGNFVPATAQYRDGLLMLAGFATWPILGIMEFYGRRVILKWIDTKLGVDESANAIADSKNAEDKFFSPKVELAVEPEPTPQPTPTPAPPSLKIMIADKTHRK
jgi:uncharacterized membrane protein